MTFRQIILQYKYSIALILLFILIENVSWIIEPSFFGKLLDALIDHFYDHEKVDFVYPHLMASLGSVKDLNSRFGRVETNVDLVNNI